MERSLMTPENARLIAQDFLDRQGEVTVAGDVDATLAWCHLPCTLESLEGKVIANTEDEMRAICVSFINGLKEKQLTHMMRRCLEAEFKDNETVLATYETRYIREGKYLTQDPYNGIVTLRWTPERWKISAMRFVVAGDSPANVTLRRTTLE